MENIVGLVIFQRWANLSKFIPQVSFMTTKDTSLLNQC